MQRQINQRTISRRIRVRHKLKANSQRPRLTVFRSSKHISAQIIDDQKGLTLASSSDKNLKSTKKEPLTKTQKATLIGEDLAQKALKQKLLKVTFDRGSYKYHGRIKALADAARSKGLEF